MGDLERISDKLLDRQLTNYLDSGERVAKDKGDYIDMRVDYYIDHEAELIQKAKDRGMWNDHFADLAARIAENEWAFK